MNPTDKNPPTDETTGGALDPLRDALEIENASSNSIETENFIDKRPAEPKPVESDSVLPTEESVTAEPVGEADVDLEPGGPRVPPVNPHVVQTERYSEPHPKIERVPLADSLTMPTVPVVELNELIDQFPQQRLDQTEYGRDWLKMIVDSQSFLMLGNALDSAQKQSDSEWVNRIEIEGERYGIAKPRFGDEKEAGLLTGARARQVLAAATGLGATLRVPLWHSGIYVTFNAPKDNDLLQLHRMVETEKLTLGRFTHAMLYSNSAVTTNRHLIDFALRHIYTASVSFDNIEELKKIIRLSDLQTIIWGLLCTIYPAGYPYRRPCVLHPNKCQHVVSENLLLTKLAYHNHRRMTPEQKRHMRTRAGKATLEDIRKYQDVVPLSVNNEVVLNDTTRVYLRSPTLAEYIESGTAWIDSLQSATDEAFAGRLSAEQTNTHIVEAAQTTAIRNYAHYVDSIVIRNEAADGENRIVERESLENALADLSANSDIYEKIVTAVGRYIDDSTVFMLAIPRYTCPACEQDQGVIPVEPDPSLPADQQPGPIELSSSKHPYIIPLDMTSLFFITTGHRITRALMNRQFR